MKSGPMYDNLSEFIQKTEVVRRRRTGTNEQYARIIVEKQETYYCGEKKYVNLHLYGYGTKDTNRSDFEIQEEGYFYYLELKKQLSGK